MASPCYGGALLIGSKEHEFIKSVLKLLLWWICINMLKIDCIVTSDVSENNNMEVYKETARKERLRSLHVQLITLVLHVTGHCKVSPMGHVL